MDILALGIGNLVGSDVLVLALIVAVLFGAKRLPEIARNIGQGLNEFRRARDEIDNAGRSPGTHTSHRANCRPGESVGAVSTDGPRSSS